MTNVDAQSTSDHPRSLRSLFLDLKSDLKTKSESSFKIKKKFDECVASSSDLSGNSNSNFDEELSLFLRNTNQNGNLLDLVSKKYLIGHAMSEAFSGTDLDAYTLFHLWNTKRTSHQSVIFSNQGYSANEEPLELTNSTEQGHKDNFIVFFQQLFFSWQSELESIDRKRPLFKIPPQDNSLVHAIEPKTTCLVLLSYLYGLDRLKFLGLRNDPYPSRIPGPYLSLLNMESKTDFVTCVDWISNHLFNKAKVDHADSPSCGFNCDGYLSISYFVYELDLIYSYILLEENCYANYTEPILLKSYTGSLFGKSSLLVRSYRMRSSLSHLSMAQVLSRLDTVLSLICKIFSDFRSSSRDAPLDKHVPQNFNFFCFVALVYSYLYAILSIPLHLLPWENFVLDKPLPPECSNDAEKEPTSPFDTADPEPDPAANTYCDYDNPEQEPCLESRYNILDISVHNEFAETAADSTCVENTRRHDNLMSYLIGLVNGEGNWIKRKEKFVDVIDTYKLGLSWYRRPSFSNTLYNTSYKAWPIALFYYNLLIEPCGRAFFVWYWKNIEAWSSSNIWSYRVKLASHKDPPLSQFLKRLRRRKQFHTDSNLQLKRLVSLRLRDTAAYLFDMELELKRALLYS